MTRREKLKPFTLYTEVLELIEEGVVDFKGLIGEEKSKANVKLIVEMALEDGLRTRSSFLSTENTKNLFTERYQKLLMKAHK